MAKAKHNFSDETIANYEAVIASIPGIKRKGAANPYTSHNGHMFSFLFDDGLLAIRLPKQKLEEFLEKYKTEKPIRYNTVMKEYATVPSSLFQRIGKLSKYFRDSFDYVDRLEPK